jgi:hypothetical protein
MAGQGKPTKHALPKTSETVCKFCQSNVPVVLGTMHWCKPTDQFLEGHSEADTGFPCVQGSGLPLFENMNGYTGDPNYPTLWYSQRQARLRAVGKP